MKVIKYETPASPIDAILDRFNWGFPLLDRVFSEPNGEESWAQVRLPRTNVRETDDSYVFTMEMPGLTRQNIEVNLEGDTLIVKGQKEERHEEKGLLRREYRSARFERSFNVGAGIDRDKVKAKMEDGILTVTLPKTPEKVGRKIDVA
jgi:HSP20 family protein